MHPRESSAAAREKGYPAIVSVALALPVLGKYVPLEVAILSISLNAARVGILILAVVAFLRYCQRETAALTVPDIGLLVVLVTMVASVAWSETVSGSWTAANNFFFWILVFVATVGVLQTERDIENFAYYLSVPVFAIVLVGAFAVLAGISSRVIFAGGPTYNSFARDLIALFPVTGMMVVVFDRFKILNAISSLLILFIVPASGSRSGVVGLAVASFLLLVFYLGRVRGMALSKTLPAAGVALVVGAVIIRIGVALDLFGARLLSIPLTLGEAFSPSVIGKRYFVYQKTVEVLAEHWLTGIGYASFFNLYEYGAHNPITRIWLAAGIIPVLIIVAAYFQTLRYYAWAYLRTDNPLLVGFLIGLISLTIAGFVNIMLNEPIFYIYFAIGSHTCGLVLKNRA